MAYKTIGILGGMGPLATADLYKKIVTLTDAQKDQEHIPTIIISNPHIPDRTAAIRGEGVSPLREMMRSSTLLENAGADFIVIACNAAHHYYDELNRRTRVPVLNMIEIAANAVRKLNVKKVALLATDGTIESGIYSKYFNPLGIEIINPGKYRSVIMDLIYNDIKFGKEKTEAQVIRDVTDSLKGQGAELFVLGCTELPIAFERHNIRENIIDPTTELAKRAILCAGGRIKS